MMEQIIDAIGIKATDDQIVEVIHQILNKTFKGSDKGLVYGFGHAVYTLSDPRAEIMRHYCGILAKEKGMNDVFRFYNRFERLAMDTLTKEKGVTMCSNVDFYSGFAYNMLGIPRDLYTPLFVISRMVGWLAHNIEHKLYDNRIVRPAAKIRRRPHGLHSQKGQINDEDNYRI